MKQFRIKYVTIAYTFILQVHISLFHFKRGNRYTSHYRVNLSLIHYRADGNKKSSAMLRLLSERETGQSEPLFLRRAETTRRYFNLALSKYRDVEGIHKGSINSVDIDTVENR